jgi:alpha-beta hydrolase superfamily lysophospholipase
LGETTAPFQVQTFVTSDAYTLHYRHYVPTGRHTGQPRAHLVFLHGIQSHAGWYEYSCTRLAKEGFLISFLDRRGSGMNREGRGDAPGFKRLVRDVAEFIEDAQRTETATGVLPVFLLGISWGAKLAAGLQRFRPGLVRGLGLLCPGFFPRVGLPLAERLRIAWSRLTAPARLYPIPLNDPELFTATPRWLEFLRGDSLSLYRATARFLVESVRLDRYLRSVPSLVRVPVLLMLAERDRIIDNTATRRFVERFKSPERKIIEYPGAHHTLEFEPDPEPFLKDLTDWLAANT